jgi:hypothetical protein
MSTQDVSCELERRMVILCVGELPRSISHLKVAIARCCEYRHAAFLYQILHGSRLLIVCSIVQINRDRPVVMYKR